MATLEKLRRQIDTAKDLSSVVTTMKTLAAVSIHQYERAVEALREYNRTIELGFQIALRGETLRFEAMEASERVGVVVFGSDQGMCGQFNERIAGFLRDRRHEAADADTWRLLVIGARVEGQLLDSPLPIDHTYSVPTSASDITNRVQELLPRIENWRETTGLSRLLVFYNRRVGASSFEPQCHQLLPIDPVLIDRWRGERWDSRSLRVFVTDGATMLSRLVRHYLFVSLFRACAESLASENASRIAAMQAAEKNIEERLEDLNRSFNQLRQSAITEELLDVVTGFEALSQGRRKPTG